MKAARALADITVEQLADRIGGRGLGTKTLYNVERGERPLQPREIATIAEACEVPAAFFTADLHEVFDEAPPALATRVDELERQVAELVRRFGADAPASPPDELLQMPEESPTNARSTRHATRTQDTDSRSGTGR
jgi:transcriptional regulator with XRE-family HTH domain